MKIVVFILGQPKIFTFSPTRRRERRAQASVSDDAAASTQLSKKLSAQICATAKRAACVACCEQGYQPLLASSKLRVAVYCGELLVGDSVCHLL